MSSCRTRRHTHPCYEVIKRRSVFYFASFVGPLSSSKESRLSCTEPHHSRHDHIRQAHIEGKHEKHEGTVMATSVQGDMEGAIIAPQLATRTHKEDSASNTVIESGQIVLVLQVTRHGKPREGRSLLPPPSRYTVASRSQLWGTPTPCIGSLEQPTACVGSTSYPGHNPRHSTLFCSFIKNS